MFAKVDFSMMELDATNVIIQCLHARSAFQILFVHYVRIILLYRKEYVLVLFNITNLTVILACNAPLVV